MFIEAINTVQVHATSGRSDIVGAQLANMVETLRDTPGCLSYAITRSHLNVDVWIVSGHWESKEAMEVHFNHPALNDFTDLLACNVVRRIDFNTFFTPQA